MNASDVIDALVARLPRAIVRLDELGVSQDALSEAVASGSVEVWLSLSSAILAQSEAARRGLQLHASDDSRPGDLAAWQWYAKPPHERSKSVQLDPPAPEVEPPDEDEIKAWCARPKHRGWERWQDQRDKSTLRPRYILSTLSPWSEHPRKAGEVCPCCGGQALELLIVCLACLRSGLDPWLPKPKPLPRHSYQPHESLKGGRG